MSNSQEQGEPKPTMEEELAKLLQFASGFGTGSRVDFRGMLNMFTLEALRQLRAQVNSQIRRMEGGMYGAKKSQTPFTILGVDPFATKDEVDRAYTSKAKVAHPDAGGSNEAMTRLNMARDAIYNLRGWK